ncbi:Werner Syndrome-like exonuclease [Diachasma alloeum]|uniref:Werner Syndrome-like exonuclease n=1 Tax=Diachasma alloeum TaxID=454923 RepID=UPI00073850E8|nr:Werner Syndrome-like exonuclease [Diachasma alloeum]
MSPPTETKDEAKDRVIEGRVTRRSIQHLPEHLKKEFLKEEVVDRDPIIEELPEILFKGKLYYVTDFEGCAMICDQIIERIEKHPGVIVPIGFDLEWPFSFQTGPGKTALAQLSVSENTCHLLHIHGLDKLPAGLVILLSHPRVKLVGVNIKNDIWKLGRDFKEFPAKKVVENNCIDCGPLANEIYKRSCRWSLERLTAYILKKKISKDDKVRKSKWHILPLSEEQKTYAATDAYVSLLLYLTIQKKAKELTLEKEKNLMKSSDLQEN